MGNIVNTVKSFSNNNAGDVPFQKCYNVPIGRSGLNRCSDDDISLTGTSEGFHKELSHDGMSLITSITSKEGCSDGTNFVTPSTALAEQSGSDEANRDKETQNENTNTGAGEPGLDEFSGKAGSIHNQSADHIFHNLENESTKTPTSLMISDDFSNKVSSEGNCSKDPELADELERSSRDKVLQGIHTSRMIQTPFSYVHQSQFSRGKSVSISTLESLGRSRKGRLIVPRLDPGSQNIIYGRNGIIGITNWEPHVSQGSNSDPPSKKRKRSRRLSPDRNSDRRSGCHDQNQVDATRTNPGEKIPRGFETPERQTRGLRQHNNNTAPNSLPTQTPAPAAVPHHPTPARPPPQTPPGDRTPPSVPAATKEMKCVMLVNWWLERLDDGKICISGVTETPQLRKEGWSSQGSKKSAARVFKAVIKKRCCSDQVETMNGHLVLLYGLLNKTRMHENGFSEEVCECFWGGFPRQWEELIDGKLNLDAQSPLDSEYYMDKFMGDSRQSTGWSFFSDHEVSVLGEAGTLNWGNISVKQETEDEVSAAGTPPQSEAIQASEENKARTLRSGRVLGRPISAPTTAGGNKRSKTQHKASKDIPNEADLSSHENDCSGAAASTEDKLKSHDACPTRRGRSAKKRH